MNALKLTKTIDDATVEALPELRPFAGRRVEIIVLDGQPSEGRAVHTLEEFLATRRPWPPSRAPVTLAEMEDAIGTGHR